LYSIEFCLSTFFLSLNRTLPPALNCDCLGSGPADEEKEIQQIGLEQAWRPELLPVEDKGTQRSSNEVETTQRKAL
jgi:hypothetical protein